REECRHAGCGRGRGGARRHARRRRRDRGAADAPAAGGVDLRCHCERSEAISFHLRMTERDCFGGPRTPRNDDVEAKMSYWLVKSEPDAWSWAQQVEAGAKGTAWTGVRNHTAKQNLMKMKTGDRAFFYHSGVGKEIVGVAEVTREHFPDPTDKSGAFVVVDLKTDEKLPKPVTLVAIKAEPKLKDMALVKYSRLSVQPVTAEEWKIGCRMGGLKG